MRGLLKMTTIVHKKLFQSHRWMIMQKHMAGHQALGSVVTIIHALDFIGYGSQVFDLSTPFIQRHRLANNIVGIFYQKLILKRKKVNWHSKQYKQPCRLTFERAVIERVFDPIVNDKSHKLFEQVLIVFIGFHILVWFSEKTFGR